MTLLSSKVDHFLTMKLRFPCTSLVIADLMSLFSMILAHVTSARSQSTMANRLAQMLLLGYTRREEEESLEEDAPMSRYSQYAHGTRNWKHRPLSWSCQLVALQCRASSRWITS